MKREEVEEEGVLEREGKAKVERKIEAEEKKVEEMKGIAITQPRRVAAIALAKRVAD